MAEKWIKDRNFRNLLRFYEAELTQILNGDPAMNALTRRERYKLSQAGIIRQAEIGGRRVELTDKAHRILKAMRKRD